jgi:hypothetical protein
LRASRVTALDVRNLGISFVFSRDLVMARELKSSMSVAADHRGAQTSGRRWHRRIPAASFTILPRPIVLVGLVGRVGLVGLVGRSGKSGEATLNQLA